MLNIALNKPLQEEGKYLCTQFSRETGNSGLKIESTIRVRMHLDVLTKNEEKQETASSQPPSAQFTVQYKICNPLPCHWPCHYLRREGNHLAKSLQFYEHDITNRLCCKRQQKGPPKMTTRSISAKWIGRQNYGNKVIGCLHSSSPQIFEHWAHFLEQSILGPPKVTQWDISQ